MACSMRAATSARLPAPTSHKLRRYDVSVVHRPPFHTRASSALTHDVRLSPRHAPLAPGMDVSLRASVCTRAHASTPTPLVETHRRQSYPVVRSHDELSTTAGRCSAATRRPAVASAKRVAPRGAGASLRCRAAAGDGGDDDEDTQTVVLTGKLGQNVRQGMDGWNTRVQVQKVRSTERGADSESGADSARVAELSGSGGRWGGCPGLVRRKNTTAGPQGGRRT